MWPWRRRSYSSLSGAVLPPDSVYFGEVSLTGAVRAVPHAVARLKEAAKLGFTRAVAPAAKGTVAKGSAANGRDAGEAPLAVDAITSLGDIVAPSRQGIAPQQRQAARGMTRGPHRAIPRAARCEAGSVQIRCAFRVKPSPTTVRSS